MTVRTRILLVFLLALTSGFFALERWLSLELRPRYYQAVEEPLVDMANLLAEIAAAGFDRPVPDFKRLQHAFERTYLRDPKADIYGLDKNAIDIRVYITDRNGIVIFDSYSKDVGEDFSNWRDVYLTQHGKYGARSTPLTAEVSPRLDDREAHSIAYVAAPIYRDGDLVGVLSVGKPKVNITQVIRIARRDLLWAVLGIAVLALAVMTLLYLWLSRPLYQVAQFAERSAQGETLSPPALGNNEIGGVARAIAEMRQALDGKQYIERYTQTLAHELKSPLTSIQASTELLLEDMPPSQRQRFIANIQSENERALKLIQRLLELALVENRHGVVNKQSLTIDTLINEIAVSLQTALLQKKLILNIKGQINTVFRGERFLVKQALFNVMDNAIAFSPQGGQITIKVILQEDKISLLIHDQGPGIPDYAKDRIFERFYSLPRPGSQSRSSGLGLNFVKEVMDLHQGTVKLTSDANGTDVELVFPL